LKAYLKTLPTDFGEAYQRWYSEAKILVKQLLPDRLEDFVAHYEKPKNRKEVTHVNYRVLDYLQGLIVVTRGYDKQKVVGLESAILKLLQQLAIVKAIEARFDSSLFDIVNLCKRTCSILTWTRQQNLPRRSSREPQGQWQASCWNATWRRCALITV
jgi:hypothetical protein